MVSKFQQMLKVSHFAYISLGKHRRKHIPGYFLPTTQWAILKKSFIELHAELWILPGSELWMPRKIYVALCFSRCCGLPQTYQLISFFMTILILDDFHRTLEARKNIWVHQMPDYLSIGFRVDSILNREIPAKINSSVTSAFLLFGNGKVISILWVNVLFFVSKCKIVFKQFCTKYDTYLKQPVLFLLLAFAMSAPLSASCDSRYCINSRLTS